MIKIRGNHKSKTRACARVLEYWSGRLCVESGFLFFGVDGFGGYSGEALESVVGGVLNAVTGVVEFSNGLEGLVAKFETILS